MVDQFVMDILLTIIMPTLKLLVVNLKTMQLQEVMEAVLLFVHLNLLILKIVNSLIILQIVKMILLDPKVLVVEFTSVPHLNQMEHNALIV